MWVINTFNTANYSLCAAEASTNPENYKEFQPIEREIGL